MSDLFTAAERVYEEWANHDEITMEQWHALGAALRQGDQIATLTAERDHWKQEAEGYQRAVKECEDKDNKTAVILVWNGSEMRVFGPTPGQEQAMGETVAQYIKITKALVDDARIKALTAERDAAKAHIDGIRLVLRTECADADVEVPELHLGDVIEKYLCRALWRKIEVAEAERDAARKELSAATISRLTEADGRKRAEAEVARLRAELAKWETVRDDQDLAEAQRQFSDSPTSRAAAHLYMIAVTQRINQDRREIARLRALVEAHPDRIEEAWKEGYFAGFHDRTMGQIAPRADARWEDSDAKRAVGLL